ncbi:MAG: hypothetical protein U1E14_07945 [Geminicoccaceae bacterium]
MATIVDDARAQLLASMNVLMRRRADTPDPAEKSAITRSLKALDTELKRLDQAELLDAAVSIAAASDALEKAVGAAKLRPFDTYLADAQEAIKRLEQLGGDMHMREALPSADATDETIPAPPAAPPAPAAAGAVAPPSTSTRFGDLAAEYVTWFGACSVRAERQDNVGYYVSRLLKFKATYAGLGAELNGIPWSFIGIVHGMEAGFDFNRHLHNGDPLTDRTRQVPKGRPPTGAPPFTWRASATDALMMKDLHQVDSWSLARMLYELERYNGFGYRRRALASPYLWSFTSLYTKGKYVRDHEFDPEAVSKQCGAAAILKGLAVAGEALPA